METPNLINTMTEAAGKSDPLSQSVILFLVFLLILITISKPIMGLIRQFRSDKSANAQDDASAALYRNLQNQIEQNARDIREIIIQRDTWQQEAVHLRTRVERLDYVEQSMKKMEAKLIEKETKLEQRDIENRSLVATILEMKDRIHSLELRLADDENRFCTNVDCERYRKLTT